MLMFFNPKLNEQEATQLTSTLFKRTKGKSLFSSYYFFKKKFKNKIK